MKLVRAILDHRIAVAESKIPETEGVELQLLPGESTIVHHASKIRRCQFSVGRMLCRRAMGELGFPASAVLQDNVRAPVWPNGIVGSISHSDNWCAAAVARQENIRSLGIDVEPMSPIEEELWPIFCTDRELDWIRSLHAVDRGLGVKLIFSAKESFYKAQYPLTRKFCEYDAASIKFDLRAGRWWCDCRQDLNGVFNKGHVFAGRFEIRAGMVATSMIIEHAN